MSFDKFCPGSSHLRNPMPESVDCPHCGSDVEIWTDELKARCPNCGNTVYRERLPSCIDWCRYAEECVGPEIYRRLKGLSD